MRPDVVAQLRPLEEALKPWLDAFTQFAACVGAVIQSVAAAPPSPGYEPWFTSHNIDPIVARMMARLVVQVGNRKAKEQHWYPDVVKAMRFLADPNHGKLARQKRIHFLLSAWQETSIIETIFDHYSRDESSFIQALETTTKGDNEAHQRVTVIARSIAPELSVSRGPKISAASAAHEYFLNMANRIEPRSYTWNDSEDKCTDPVTEATRLEFGQNKFDPRPACRRTRRQGKFVELVP